jgi:hypothetical protein
MKTALYAAAIGTAMLTGYGLSAPPAQAAFVVDLTQQGANVVASGSGAFDLTGLSFIRSLFNAAFIWPDSALIYTGPPFPPGSEVDIYTGITTGPTSFGSGGESFPSSGSGDLVGIENGVFGHALFVPTGYVSDSPLSDTSTYDNQTFSGLGVTPGTYKWTWGSGADADSFTLQIGPAAVPEPSTWAMMLLGFVGLGYAGYRAGQKGTLRHSPT